MSETSTFESSKARRAASRVGESNAPPRTAKIGFIYGSSGRHISERYLVEAFEPGEISEFDLDVFRPDVSVNDLVKFTLTHGEGISHLVHCIGASGLPRDLHQSPLPTACLNIDNFSWMDSRFRWAMLFDHVFVWQPRFVPMFQKAGHPSVFLLPHGVEGRLFNGTETDRCFDLGWVGHIGPAWYARRNRIIPKLAARFQINDFYRKYSKEETAKIYQKSKIVVNVTRDEFPPEANMRCYEAMAGGALLITPMPTELTELGFREGEHFVGWSDETQIGDLVQRYLSDEPRRREIARTGQDLVLREHTFERRRETLRTTLLKQGDQFFAPARRWPLEEIQLTYLEYYYRYQVFSALFKEFSSLGKTNRRAALRGAPMVLKALRHGILRSLR
jgi:hypothetical protein